METTVIAIVAREPFAWESTVLSIEPRRHTYPDLVFARGQLVINGSRFASRIFRNWKADVRAQYTLCHPYFLISAK